MNLSTGNAVCVCVFESKTKQWCIWIIGLLVVISIHGYLSHISLHTQESLASFLIRLMFRILGVPSVCVTALIEFECEMLNPPPPLRLLPDHQIILPSEKNCDSNTEEMLNKQKKNTVYWMTTG